MTDQINDQQNNDKSKIIAQHNDEFRSNFGNTPTTTPQIPGKYIVTQGILSLDTITQFEIMLKVREFKDFTPNNDPHGEHDFGKFELNLKEILWKVDYYDLDYKYGSEDPSNLNKTRRVLTTMLACEY